MTTIEQRAQSNQDAMNHPLLSDKIKRAYAYGNPDAYRFPRSVVLRYRDGSKEKFRILVRKSHLGKRVRITLSWGKVYEGFLTFNEWHQGGEVRGMTNHDYQYGRDFTVTVVSGRKSKGLTSKEINVMSRSITKIEIL